MYNHAMTWFWFAIISIISVSLANVLQRKLMAREESDPVSYTIVFQFMVTLMTGIFALIKGFHFPIFQGYAINYILAGMFWGGMSLLSFKALQVIGAGEMTIISSVSTFVTIIMSVLLLDETFGYAKIVGTMLIFGAIVLLYGKKKFQWNKGIVYALGAAVCAGLALINDTIILKGGYDAVSYTPIISFIPGVFIILIQPKSFKRIPQVFHGTVLKNMLLFCGFYAFQAVTYYIALERGANAGQLSAIIKSSIILTVLFAAILLKERNDMGRKIASAVLATIAILLLR